MNTGYRFALKSTNYSLRLSIFYIFKSVLLPLKWALFLLNMHGCNGRRHDATNSHKIYETCGNNIEVIH